MRIPSGDGMCLVFFDDPEAPRFAEIVWVNLDSAMDSLHSDPHFRVFLAPLNLLL
jgi:hypothetical protein